MKMLALLLSASLLASPVAATSQEPLGEGAPTTLEGRVLTEDGRPAAGAVVISSAGGQTLTESNGTFRLEVLLPHGVQSVQLTAVANGASDQVGSAQVSGLIPGTTTQVDSLTMQQSLGCQPSWLPTFGGAPGTSDSVHALAVFDDGQGGGPALYAAGSFGKAGGTVAQSIARWDGARWWALGAGVNGMVNALTVFDDGSGGGSALYVGGDFTSAGAIGANYIAKWDGGSWSALGTGLSDRVHALTVYDDGNGGGPALQVGGEFTSAGGLSANYVAKWDGASWSALGSGVTDIVKALQVYDEGTGAGPALFVGGHFHGAGGIAAHGIAKWNGSSWRAIGGMDKVSALAVFDDGSGGGPALFVGGTFSNVGGVAANGIAKWDGVQWSALGSGVGGGGTPQVLVLTVFDDGSGGGSALYVGGDFTSAGAIGANYIAKWDGVAWSALGSGANGAVRALTVFDDGSGSALYAGGDFVVMGGIAVGYIGSWDGVVWSGIGTGLSSNFVFALEVFDDNSGGGPALFASGYLLSPGGVSANSSVVRWNGSDWSAVGGANGYVRALTVFDDGSGSALYGGGNFSSIGGVAANRIAKWDGSSWSALGSGVAGSLNRVYALTTFDDGNGGGPALFAGGIFTSAGGVAAASIAKWDGSSWSSLGSGMSSGSFPSVSALRVFDDGSGGGPALFAGGDFTSAGGVAAKRIAKWDGAGWSALAGGVNRAVYALTVFDDGSGGGPALYVGGEFTSAGGSPATGMARWDGSSWSSLGSGVSSGSFPAVHALTVFDDGSGPGPVLYAGGNFVFAGGMLAEYIAKWDGSSWSSLGGGKFSRSPGFFPDVLALTVFDDGNGAGPALIAGGDFGTSPAGDSRVAKWGCPSPTPVVSFCTAKTTLFCGAANIGATGASSATAASGFVIQAQPVRGCRAGLLLYSNQPAQPAASFGGPGDGLLCLIGMGLRRAGPIESGGTSPQVCDGMLSIDMNQFRALNWAASGCNPAVGQTIPAGFLGNMGITVNAQIWGRDSVATGQVLTDGISWDIGP